MPIGPFVYQHTIAGKLMLPLGIMADVKRHVPPAQEARPMALMDTAVYRASAVDHPPAAFGCRGGMDCHGVHHKHSRRCVIALLHSPRVAHLAFESNARLRCSRYSLGARLRSAAGPLARWRPMALMLLNDVMAAGVPV